jgi:circadian clock protein KaiC
MTNQLVSTGIAGLDSLLCGGFVRGRTYIITGDTGTGKTVACLQFLNRALSQGEKAVYVTVDERPSEITDSAESFSWNLQTHIQEKNLAILDASPYFSGRSSSSPEKGIDPQKIVADLGNYVKRLAATLLIIDPVTPFSLPSDPNCPPQDQARSLINLLQSQLSTTNLLTAHWSGSSQHRAAGIEEFLASGAFLLKLDTSGEKAKRTITIRKMRGAPVTAGEFPFEISAREGIAIRRSGVVSTGESGPLPTFEQFELPAK